MCCDHDFTIASFQPFLPIKHRSAKLAKKFWNKCMVHTTSKVQEKTSGMIRSLPLILVPIQANVTPAIPAIYCNRHIFERFTVELLRSKQLKTCASSAGMMAGSWNSRVRNCSCLNSLEYWNYTRDLASDNLMNTFDESWQNPDNSWLLLTCIHRRLSNSLIEMVAHQYDRVLGQLCAATRCRML